MKISGKASKKGKSVSQKTCLLQLSLDCFREQKQDEQFGIFGLWAAILFVSIFVVLHTRKPIG